MRANVLCETTIVSYVGLGSELSNQAPEVVNGFCTDNLRPYLGPFVSASDDKILEGVIVAVIVPVLTYIIEDSPNVVRSSNALIVWVMTGHVKLSNVACGVTLTPSKKAVIVMSAVLVQLVSHNVVRHSQRCEMGLKLGD